MNRMEWRPVVGYEGLYEINEAGGMRSLPREIKHHTGKIMLRKARPLRWCTHGKYAQVTLTKDGRSRTVIVHAAVAAAFIGPRPEGALIRHKDGNRLNNDFRNLAYGTSRTCGQAVGNASRCPRFVHRRPRWHAISLDSVYGVPITHRHPYHDRYRALPSRRHP